MISIVKRQTNGYLKNTSHSLPKAVLSQVYQHLPTHLVLLKRIIQSERERKDIAGIKKLANQRAKKANLHNKKLRDCRIHFNDKKSNSELKNDTMIFITEGDSASGSITKSRNVPLKNLKCFKIFRYLKKDII